MLIDMIEQLRFGLIVTAPDADTFETVQVPVLVKQDSDHLVLESHVSTANPIWKTADDRAALLVFQGPHAYVHPGWYATKKQTGKVVPTWNYISVQVRGRMRAVSDPVWLRAHVGALTQCMEKDRADPWSVDDAPDEYITALLDKIVGLRIEVSSLDGVWKMSQNHPETNRIGAADGLAASGIAGEIAVADLMRGLEADRD